MQKQKGPWSSLVWQLREIKLGKSEKKGAFQQQKQPRECMLLSLSYGRAYPLHQSLGIV